MSRADFLHDSSKPVEVAPNLPLRENALTACTKTAVKYVDALQLIAFGRNLHQQIGMLDSSFARLLET